MKKQKALAELYPSSPASRCLQDIASRLCGEMPEGRRGEVFAFSAAGPFDPAVNRNGRDEQILQYAPLVKQVVSRMTGRLMMAPADRDALVQAGVIGLMAALEKFDETKNVRFETYAKIRIRGAVLDEMRAADRVPRSVRTKDTKIEKAFATLQKRSAGPPMSRRWRITWAFRWRNISSSSMRRNWSR